MERKKLDLSQPVMTSDGRKARIIASDRKSPGGACIVILVKARDDSEYEGILTCDEFGVVSENVSFHLVNKPNCLPVRDGEVIHGEKVWWRYNGGPELVIAQGHHWINIREYPNSYQLTEPKTKIVYLDEGL